MRLARLYPEWDRSCDTCERFQFNANGSLKLDRIGLPMATIPGTHTPCGVCEKVPAPVRATARSWRECRAAAVEMTEANRRAWGFYRECRAVGEFPRDPLVRWAAATISDIEDLVEREPMVKLTRSIEDLVATIPRRRK